MADGVFRIHPAIGIARVGNSQDYYLAPETIAGMPQDGTALTGGLPIRPGTESDTITSADLRDANGALKRQAARFRIYSYPDNSAATWPSGAGEEIVIGSTIGGKTVADIVWTVHLANKKANNWQSPDDTGILAYRNGALPPLRNADFAGSSDPAHIERRARLVIDAGPRAIRGAGKVVACNDRTTPTAFDGNKVREYPDYPAHFPSSADFGQDLYCPSSEAITSLGELRTDDKGRLLVLGGFGRACGFRGNPTPLDDDVNNDNWLDDTADGPVTAAITFDDGSVTVVPGSAWAVATDPAYAPQTLNVVSLWDEVFDTWLREFGLDSSIYDPGEPVGGYVSSYAPDFWSNIFPIFRAASLQMWNTNLPTSAIAAHDSVDDVTPESDPDQRLYVKALIRDPEDPEQASVGSPLMPLSLGDSGKSFLTLTRTQYFFLNQWFAKTYSAAPPIAPGPGERLDKAALANCLGGRFSPGIDLTFIVRDPDLYNARWHDPAIGPFRIAMAPLDYSAARRDNPFLGVGYVPARAGQAGVEPGDICKFMAIPWHTDYNSCATHTPAPNPGGEVGTPGESPVFDGRNTSLFWSWPAQRPVAVYTFEDLAANAGALPPQRFSVRGAGTEATGPFPAQSVGRYQNREDILTHWDRIGTILQGPAIEGYAADFDPHYYLEVGSLLFGDSDPVIPWPNTVVDDPKG